MGNLPITNNEQQRLTSLYALNILDTPPEARYDRLTRLAQHLFNAPFALITLVDETRQWFKSKAGIDLTETPRELSICHYTIQQESMLIIPNLAEDGRFKNHPFVTNEPFIRFYAGYPLAAPDGSKIGTLCILDTTPRSLSKDEMQSLQDLAAIAETELNIATINQLQPDSPKLPPNLENELQKQREVALQKSEEAFRLVFELAPIGMGIVSLNGRFISVNQAFCDTLGYSVAEIVQKTVADITHPDDLENEYAIDRNLLTGKSPHLKMEKRYIHKNDTIITAIWQVTLVKNSDGSPIHFIVQMVDITQRTTAADTLKQQQAFLNQVIDTVPHYLAVKDRQGRFTLANQALADLYGTTVESIVGKRDVDFGLFDDAMMRFYNHDLIVMDTGEEARISEEQIVDAQGKPRWLQTITRPIIGPSQSIDQVVSIAIDISAQKQAEKTIRASQQKLALHFQNTPVGVIEWSPDFEVVDWNPAAEQIFGYTREEVLKRRGTFIMQTGTQEFFDSIWHHLLNRQSGTGGIQQNIRKDRKEITCQWYNTPLRDEKGQIIGVASLIEDISERIAAEEALRESEARLVKTTENAPGLIFQFVLQSDKKAYFTYINAWATRVFGLSVKVLYGDATEGLELVHEDDRQSIIASIGESAKLLSPWRWVGRMISKQGKVLHVQGEAKPELMENGDTIWNGVLIDITEQVQAEEERDRLFNLSVDMMAIGGIDGYFKRLNPAFKTILGYSQEELLEAPIIEFVHPDDIEATVTQIKALGKAEPAETFRFETRFRCKDGPYKWLDWTAVSAQYNFYAVARDVTQRKQVEADLIVSRDRALEVSRLKSELIAKVSHELRTPLGAILGYSEMLQIGVYGPISNQQHDITSKIIDSTEYLSKMVNELLDQAQLEANQLKLSLTEFDPRAVIQTVQSRMTILAQNRSLTLVSQVEPALAETIVGDETRIQQILVNLVSNAIKFTKVGTVKIIASQPDALHWQIIVSDTGIGIPAEAHAYIFDPFSQVDGSITREHMGTGLGLSIVAQLITLMGGKIQLKSQVGRGSTFTVTLPVNPKK